LGCYNGLGVAPLGGNEASMLSLGSGKVVTFRVVETKSTTIQLKDLYYLGQTKTQSSTIKNPSPLPLIVGLSGDGPNATWEPDWFFLLPGEEREIRLSITAAAVGDQELKIRQGIFLPLLPTDVIQGLAEGNWHLPIFVISFVPVLGILILAASDDRVWIELHHLKVMMDLRVRG